MTTAAAKALGTPPPTIEKAGRRTAFALAIARRHMRHRQIDGLDGLARIAYRPSRSLRNLHVPVNFCGILDLKSPMNIGPKCFAMSAVA